MIQPRYNDARTIAEIPVRTSKLPSVVNALRLNGVPEVCPGEPGWQYGEDGIVITGTASAVQQAVDVVLYVLNGPKFERADVIAARVRKGAMS